MLIVEDDESIAESLAELLGREGFDVDRARTAASALGCPLADLVLLDLGLPDLDGQELCRAFRARSAVPIIVLTARGAEDDRVQALETGADDYVVKPYGSRELVARIRAVLRRVTGGGVGPGTQVIGALEIDRRERRVKVDSADVACTPKEFGILDVLAEDPGALVTRQQLLDAVWGPHWYGPTKMIDVHVASLRRKLGRPDWVETVWGVGFRLQVEAPVEG